MDKLKETNLGERVILAAAAVLFLDSFLPWYSIDLGTFGSYSKNGWGEPDQFMSIVAILIGIAMATGILLHRLEVTHLPEHVGGVSWGVVHLVAGCLATLLVFVKWMSNTDYTAIGLYVGMLCTIGLAVGGFLRMREEHAPAPTQQPHAPGGAV
ncbi:MAG: hypothetical protein FJW88_07030 [Actinobacteria bacterium]|nr:hypothetical protein [Actinomycetota bacterium]